MPLPNTINNFMRFVRETNKCWIWTGFVDKDGYGRSGLNGKHQAAHRVAYQLFIGPIDKSLHCLHKCDNPMCVNPKHLYLGTHLDNMRDTSVRNRRHKTHCPKNHPYDTKNTRVYDGKWYCRACDRLRRPSKKLVERALRGEL